MSSPYTSGPVDPLGDGARALAADVNKVRQAFEQWLMRKIELEQRARQRDQNQDTGDIKELLGYIAENLAVQSERMRDRGDGLDTDDTSGSEGGGEAGFDEGPRRTTGLEDGSDLEAGQLSTGGAGDGFAARDVLADLEEAIAVAASREAFEASMHADEDFGADREPAADAQQQAHESEEIAQDESDDVVEAQASGDEEQVAVEEAEAQSAEGAAERDADTASDVRAEQDGHGQAEVGQAAAASAKAQTAQANATALRGDKSTGQGQSHGNHKSAEAAGERAAGNAWPNGSKTAQLAGGAFPNGQAYTPAQTARGIKSAAKTPAREKGRGLG